MEFGVRQRAKEQIFQIPLAKLAVVQISSDFPQKKIQTGLAGFRFFISSKNGNFDFSSQKLGKRSLNMELRTLKRVIVFRGLRAGEGTLILITPLTTFLFQGNH